MIKQLVGLFQTRATVLTTYYVVLFQAVHNMSHPSISCFDLFTRRMLNVDFHRDQEYHYGSNGTNDGVIHTTLP